MALNGACLVCLGILLLGGVAGVDVQGGWGPWEANPEVDCCMYGGFERVTRYCNNPSPEGNGAKCLNANNTAADLEEAWRTCNCHCNPPCDNVTSFCANDTGEAAHCACNHGLSLAPDHDLNTVTVCVNLTGTEVTTTEAPKEYPTLEPDTKKILDIVQYSTVIFFIACLIAILALFFFLCCFKPDRVIHMCEEITLAITWIFIAFLSEKADSEGLCKFTNFALQYFFLAAMTFFCLEALHTYAMVTFVVPKRGYFNTLANVGIGFGLPLLVTGICFGAMMDKYGTTGRHRFDASFVILMGDKSEDSSCWCSLDNAQAWGFFVPIVLLGFVCTVIAEAQGQGQYRTLPDTDTSEYTSARVSQGSIMIIMPLTLAAYSLALIAVERQNLYLFSIFSILNVILGPIIFFFHCVGNAQVRAILAKVFFCCPCFKGKSKYDRPPSGRRVAPKKPDENDEGGAGDGDGQDGDGDEPPSAAPTPRNFVDPVDKDANWEDLHAWAMNNDRSDIDKAGAILF